MMYDGAYCHDLLVKKIKPKLAFGDGDYETQRNQIREKFWELLGLDVIAENACPLKLSLVETEKKDGE